MFGHHVDGEVHVVRRQAGVRRQPGKPGAGGGDRRDLRGIVHRFFGFEQLAQYVAHIQIILIAAVGALLYVITQLVCLRLPCVDVLRDSLPVGGQVSDRLLDACRVAHLFGIEHAVPVVLHHVAQLGDQTRGFLQAGLVVAHLLAQGLGFDTQVLHRVVRAALHEFLIGGGIGLLQLSHGVVRPGEGIPQVVDVL